MSKVVKIVVISILVTVLLFIRAFEEQIFNDPFITFFKHDFINVDVPKYDNISLIIVTTFRYILNSTVSILILIIVFGKRILKFLILFYVIFYVVLILAFSLLGSHLDQDLHLFFFYVRRFLTQPVFLLLLAPAFYYQEVLRKK